jgi:hypothetical protein
MVIFLCFVDRASLYNLVNKTNLVHNQFHSTLHTRQPSTHNNKYQVSHKHCCFSWWWAHSRSKHVEIDKYKHTKKKVMHQVGFIYKTIVIYRCETWAVTEQMKWNLKTWKRKKLKKLYGPKTEQNSWGIETNDELQVTCRKPNIVTTIIMRRLDGPVI